MSKKKKQTEALPEATLPGAGEPPVQTVAPQEVTDQAAAPEQTIRGLMPRERMPVRFRNRTYDVARLTEGETEYLRQFPEAFPYLD